ncbi:helix-turn-helix domain-containing protein [Labedella phragmitis]
MTADYRSGLSVYAIAEKHGLHRYTVTEHLKSAGVVMRRTITEAERRRAHELYRSGANFTDIARALGRDPATVKKVIRTATPPDPASPGGPTPGTKTGPAPGARNRARAS